MEWGIVSTVAASCSIAMDFITNSEPSTGYRQDTQTGVEFSHILDFFARASRVRFTGHNKTTRKTIPDTNRRDYLRFFLDVL